MLCLSLSPRAHHSKGLAAFMKAIGYLIPLMDNWSANYYNIMREVRVILIQEFDDANLSSTFYFNHVVHLWISMPIIDLE